MLLSRRPELLLIGVDNAVGVLREALQQVQPHWIHYSLVRAQAEQLPLATNSMQAVVIGASLNELPLVPCLEEVARVLQPQGLLVSMHSQRVDEGWGHWAQQTLKLSGLQFLSRDELTAACESVGLRVQRYLSYGLIAFIQARVMK
jgi:ubiquinone/menaquinone biosynthesis C-methylase UbiE